MQVEDPASLEITEDFSALPDELADVVAAANAARAEAAELSQQAQELTTRAARALVNELGMPVRDAARLLRVSHQRVHQLVQGR